MRLPLKKQAEIAELLSEVVEREITCVSMWDDIRDLLPHIKKEIEIGEPSNFTVIVLDHRKV